MTEAPQHVRPARPYHFSLSADRGWGQRFRFVAEDLLGGLRLWRLIWALSLSDIKQRYRGSLLGPFWLTISMGVQIATMAAVYGGLFHVDIHSYLPYLTVSIISWGYMSSLISEGCSCFIQAESLIKGNRMPLFVHAARSIVRNTIIFGHNMVVAVIVFVVMDVPLSLRSMAAIPALGLWIIDALALSLLTGALCARFRDVPQIVASLMQIAFFITPIMWYAASLADHPKTGILISSNPFFYFLEIVRAPLLGMPLGWFKIGVAVAISFCMIGISVVGFARVRGRVAYWV